MAYDEGDLVEKARTYMRTCKRTTYRSLSREGKLEAHLFKRARRARELAESMIAQGEFARPRSLSFPSRSRRVDVGTRPKRSSSPTVANGAAHTSSRASSRAWGRVRGIGSRLPDWPHGSQFLCGRFDSL